MNILDAVQLKSRLKSPTVLTWIAFLVVFAWPDFYVKAGMLVVGPILSGIALYLRYREHRWSHHLIGPLLSSALWLLMWWLVLFHAFFERPQWG
jgi:hypothetical protein